MGINPKGRNWGELVNWDDLGKLFASVAIVWTVVLAVGITWLILNRRLSFIKMRNLPLAIASTCFLHTYLVKILLAYTTNGHFPCSAEFWIMSIYLPFGIALFQANMAQLLSISTQQRLLSEQEPGRGQRKIDQSRGGIGKLWARWNGLTAANRAFVLISCGMAVQVCKITSCLPVEYYDRTWMAAQVMKSEH